jgi:quinoprotein dehydrogenase-associated probable ABC transporter substrate-binding protein
MTARALVSKLVKTMALALLFGLGSVDIAAAVEGQKADLVNRRVLRVCADPANMPFSNQKGEGFENKIADIVGEALGIAVEYTWFPQATGFIRRTLFAKACDVVIGFAQGDELVLNTNHYYRSTYAMLYRKGSGLDGVNSLADPKLKGKHIGIIAGTPPGTILAQLGLMPYAKPYPLTVDRRYESPAERMIEDIRSGDIDAGILWGPIAGYFSKKGGEELAVMPLIKESVGPRMTYRITMGVRQGDDVWKRQLNQVIAQNQGKIDKVLLDYGVPLLDEQNDQITVPRK